MGISRGENKFNARVYHYIAKCKTYRRRLNKHLPNFTLEELYSEYFKITFYSLIKHTINLLKILKISKIIGFLITHLEVIPKSLISKLKGLQEKL